MRRKASPQPSARTSSGPTTNRRPARWDARPVGASPAVCSVRSSVHSVPARATRRSGALSWWTMTVPTVPARRSRTVSVAPRLAQVWPISTTPTPNERTRSTRSTAASGRAASFENSSMTTSASRSGRLRAMAQWRRSSRMKAPTSAAWFRCSGRPTGTYAAPTSS